MDWERLNRRREELERRRLARMTPTQRIEEAQTLYNELVALMTEEERQRDRDERRQHKIELRRRMRELNQ